MYLKSIEIQGFKSFANKTTLHFLPPKGDKHSITVIVGPNGSGKSNVSDAIRWVLGEQSMKQLRGKKSADIIFAGSEGKGQMSAASVSLVLDNSDKQVDIEYDELVISRKIYRTGESEYKINGSPVRLLDLQILLAKAQFAHGSYSVIGQGTIDRMLLQSAAERKAFFDEAAGIKEFQIKRHQSYLKLRRSTEHIEQSELLLKEIVPRLKTLSRQVKKLDERKTVEQQLQDLQEQYYATLTDHYQENMEIIGSDLESVGKEHKEQEAGLLEIQEELAALAREASRQDAFMTLQHDHQQIVKKKNNIEREKAVLAGKMQTEYSRVGKQNVSWLEQKIETVRNEAQDITAQVTALESQQEQLGKAIASDQASLDQLRIHRTEEKNKLVMLEQRMVQAQTNQTLMQYTGLRAVEAILSERNRFGNVYGAVAQLGTIEKEYQLALDVAAGSHLNSLVVGDDRVAQEAISYLREHRLGFATFLPMNKIRPRIIPADLDRFLGTRGVVGFAVDLINYDEKFDDIFSYVFGSTLIVEDIHVAREIGIGRVRMVTLDGDIMETSGSMKGGYRKSKQHGMSFAEGSRGYSADEEAQIKQDIESRKQSIEELDASIESLEKDHNRSVSEKELLHQKLTLLEERKQSIDTELASLEQELSLHTMSPEEYTSAMQDVAGQKDALDQELTVIEKELAAAQVKIDAFHEEEEKKKQRVFALQENMQTLQATLNEIGAQKHALQVELAKLETKQEDLGNELYQELHISGADLLKRVTPALGLDEIEAVQTQIQKLKYKLSLIGGIDDEVVAEYEETKERHDSLDTQLKDLKKTVSDLEVLIADLDEIMRKRRNKAFKHIRKEFKRYFRTLFEGGDADLIEIYGEEGEEERDEESLEEEQEVKKGKKRKILQGIEVKACPPGKKIKQLQALSGGERTMTSIALVCAILHTNPSPFVVLDEVEAALDEANSTRLNNILHELSHQSQFIMISHNRTTMHAADALYGVTMGHDGMSRLLSVKLEEAEQVVEE